MRPPPADRPEVGPAGAQGAMRRRTAGQPEVDRAGAHSGTRPVPSPARREVHVNAAGGTRACLLLQAADGWPGWAMVAPGQGRVAPT